MKIRDITAVKKSDNGTDTKTPVTLRNIGMININGIKNKNGFIIDKNNAGLGLPIYWKKLAAITWTPTKGLISISTLKIGTVNAINSLLDVKTPTILFVKLIIITKNPNEITTDVKIPSFKLCFTLSNF